MQRVLLVVLSILLATMAIARPRSGATSGIQVDTEDGMSALAVALFSQRYGVELRMNPMSTHYDLDPVEEDFVPWAIGVSEDFADAYPDGMLPQLVREIGFASGAFDDVSGVGGFASCANRRMVVTMHDHRSHDDVLDTMHHELGHLLHCKLGTPDGWADLNDQPYQGGANTWREEVWEGSRSRRTRGDAFVSGYATASLKEDIAETFEACMRGRPARATTAVDRKLDLLEAQIQGRFPAFRCSAP